MRFTFSWREAGNLAISILVLGLLFSFNNLSNIVTNTLIIGLAFAVHELAHKFTAESFDCKAEYVLWPQGILVAFMIAFLTRGNFVFAALGFVSIKSYYSTRLGYHFTHLSLEEMGKISASGPIANIILGVISAILAPIYPIMGFSATLNFILAIFNLVPFPPLDGSKIFVWSRIAWTSLIVTASVIFGLSFIINPLIAGFIGLIVMIGLIFFTFYKGL